MSINSTQTQLYHCMDSTITLKMSITYHIIKTLALFPLCVLVLLHGLHRFKHRHSFKSGSHSDVFTYHLVAIELSGLVGVPVFLIGIYHNKPVLAFVALNFTDMVLPAEMCFHILTCVERYLAVVHPVTYRRLKQSSGIWIRNVSISCVWLLCFGWRGVSVLYAPDVPVVPFTIMLLLSFTIVSFCSLNVLCVLIRPRPGNVAKHPVRTHANHSSQRALHTAMAIMAVLFLWFVSLLTCIALSALELLSYEGGCILLVIGLTTGLPSNLVLPLLFLHRARKTDLWSVFRHPVN